MKFLLDFIKGILIGAGCILPGISSGVLCVIFGIYEKILDSILNFFSDIIKNFKFLFSIALGGILGMIIFSKILRFLLYKFPMQTKSIFIGFILGGTILLYKEIKEKEKFKISNWFYLLISLAIGILMIVMENIVGIKNLENVSYIYLIFSGFLMSIGIVVPGVSSTIILMLLGVYSLYLNSISNIYLVVLFPMLIGIFLGCLLFMKIIKYLLDNFYVKTMYSIIGFSVGSIFVLMPQVNSILEFFIFSICILSGYYVIRLINN